MYHSWKEFEDNSCRYTVRHILEIGMQQLHHSYPVPDLEMAFVVQDRALLTIDRFSHLLHFLVDIAQRKVLKTFAGLAVQKQGYKSWQ